MATPTTTPIAISFVATGSLADYGLPVTNVVVSLPSGVQSGDALLAQIVVWDASGSIVPMAPNGWSLVRHDAASNGNKITSWLYFKVAGSGEPPSYSWQIASQYAAGLMGAWRGILSSSAIDQASGAAKVGASPISVAAPSLTPSKDGELQIYFYGSQNSVAPIITEPAAITQRLNIRSAKEGFTLAFGDLAAPPAGIASATYSASASGSNSVITAQAILLTAGP